MTVAFELRWAGGHKRAYPVNDKALHFCELLGMNTMPLGKVHFIERLGYTVDITDSTVRS